MTVWSVTPFLNELDVLEVRLRELDAVVDVHVICESPVTYRGDEKPLHFAEHRDRFAPWLDKIRYVVSSAVVAPMQRSGDRARWARENGQRAALREALDDVAATDVVVLSDVDEIPRAATVERYAAGRGSAIVTPQLPMHIYRVGLRIVEPQPSVLRMFRGAELAKRSPEEVRRAASTPWMVAGNDDRFGWHLSYCGGIDAVRYKVEQAAHPEEEVAEWLAPANLRRCIRFGADHRGNRRHTVVEAPPEWWPDAVRADAGRFRTLVDPLRFPAVYDGEHAVARSRDAPLPRRRRRTS